MNEGIGRLRNNNLVQRARVASEFAKPQRELFAGQGEGGACPACPPSIFMVQFRPSWS